MTREDLRRVWEVNEANDADVGSLTPDELTTRLEDSVVAVVAVAPDASVAGFAIVLDEHARHQTAAMAWAWRHNAGGLHLDRVAFDMQFSGLGLGPALYDEIDAEILRRPSPTEGGPALTALVRVEPPNRHALGFHAARGFEEIDRAELGSSTMGLLRKQYGSSPPSATKPGRR